MFSMQISETQNRKDKDILKRIAQKYDLELVLLFGSRVKGKTHKESDYDVAYLSQRELDSEEFSLFTELLPIIQPSDERLLNLVNIRKASPLLLYDITSHNQILYEKKPGIFSQLRATSFKQYVESKPLYEAKFRRLGKILKV